MRDSNQIPELDVLHSVTRSAHVFVYQIATSNTGRTTVERGKGEGMGGREGGREGEREGEGRGEGRSKEGEKNRDLNSATTMCCQHTNILLCWHLSSSHLRRAPLPLITSDTQPHPPPFHLGGCWHTTCTLFQNLQLCARSIMKPDLPLMVQGTKQPLVIPCVFWWVEFQISSCNRNQ